MGVGDLIEGVAVGGTGVFVAGTGQLSRIGACTVSPFCPQKLTELSNEQPLGTDAPAILKHGLARQLQLENVKDCPGLTVADDPAQLLGPTGLSPAHASCNPPAPAGH